MKNITIMPDGAETLKSIQVQAELASATERRDQLVPAIKSAQMSLDEARQSIDVQQPETIEVATIAQARVTVLSSALDALNAQIEQLEISLKTALEEEEKARKLLELATLRTSLDDKNMEMEALTRKVASEVQSSIQLLLDGMRESFDLGQEIHFLAMAMGLDRGPVDVPPVWNVGRIASMLHEESGIDTVTVAAFVEIVGRLESARSIERYGLPLYRDTPAFFDNFAALDTQTGATVRL